MAKETEGTTGDEAAGEEAPNIVDDEQQQYQRSQAMTSFYFEDLHIIVIVMDFNMHKMRISEHPQSVV
jgi:hypothetical protein